jgi:hypothetical protein
MASSVFFGAQVERVKVPSLPDSFPLFFAGGYISDNAESDPTLPILQIQAQSQTAQTAIRVTFPSASATDMGLHLG